MTAIHVLMSTCNGARYLEQQVDSITRQTLPAKVFVRDDGSTDDTPALLDKLAAEGRLIWTRGSNVGVAASFFYLLYGYSAGAGYVAFADQDDVWHPDKLERAVRALGGVEPSLPALYCTRATLTNAALESIGVSPLWPKPPAFGNALVENIATGCTVVLNRGAVNLITREPIPERAIFHDWWCYLVVSAFGRVIYDSEPSLLYRQHEHNAVGTAPSSLGRMAGKISRQFEQDSLGLVIDQAKTFFVRYGARLPASDLATLACLVSGAPDLATRARLLAGRRLFRQHALDDLLLHLRLALGPWPVRR